MQRIRNSWELGKISWSVLKSDRTLAWFPVLSAIGSLVVLGVFGGLIAATGVNDTSGHEGLKAIGYVFVVAMYIGFAFVATYFLGALVHGANERLNGRDAKLADSIGAANAKLHRILPWALVQGTVSIVLRSMEERAGWLGQIVVGLLGAAWSILTFLTVPIIMLEDLGPIAALKRSGALIKQTWGENVVGQAGFGLLAFVAGLPGILLLFIGIGTGSVAVAVALGIPAVAWLLAVSIVVSTMTGIYRTALYRYAVDGKAPAAFADAQLGEAFAPRGRRGSWLN
jgi:hypothetical protein